MKCSVAGTLNVLQQSLLNDWQTGMPLVSRPFQSMAVMSGCTERQVLHELEAFQEDGTVSRVGPVFRPNCIGASVLVAVMVPEASLETVAMLINGFDEVNHNYEREHAFNLWFVVTASDQATLSAVLERIERVIGYQILCLPLVKDFHIDLSFTLSFSDEIDKADDVACAAVSQYTANRLLSEEHLPQRWQGSLDGEQWHTLMASFEPLIAQIQSGLPLVPRPFEAVGKLIGWSEQRVLQALGYLCQQSVIKRLGVIVRHHELGYRANAMTVWNIPDEHVSEIGTLLGSEPEVTLCYQRPRVKGRWPYNLFCMVHGKSHDTVRQQVAQLARKHALVDVEHDVLFSKRRFKQKGAQYRTVVNGSVCTSSPMQAERPSSHRKENADGLA